LDLNEAEANKMLLTLDPLAAMAETDAQAAVALLRAVETDSDAVNALLERTFGAGDWQPGRLLLWRDVTPMVRKT
jgi:hypothetical protein